MKLFLASAAMILLTALPGFCQNTSLSYGLIRPPNPGRQVPSGDFFLAQPGMPNHDARYSRTYNPYTITRADRIRKKSSGRVYTSEPRIILIEPDLKDRPNIE